MWRKALRITTYSMSENLLLKLYQFLKGCRIAMFLSTSYLVEMFGRLLLSVREFYLATDG